MRTATTIIAGIWTAAMAAWVALYVQFISGCYPIPLDNGRVLCGNGLAYKSLSEMLAFIGGVWVAGLVAIVALVLLCGWLNRAGDAAIERLEDLWRGGRG